MSVTTWLNTGVQVEKPVDVDLVQGAALAMAQATIQQAINKRKISRTALARRMGRQRSFVTRMMSGDYNMTIRTFALALAACSYRPTFGFAPVTWTWADNNDKPTVTNNPVPASAGTLMRVFALA